MLELDAYKELCDYFEIVDAKEKFDDPFIIIGKAINELGINREIIDVLKKHPDLDLSLIHRSDSYEDYDDYTFNTKNHLSKDEFIIMKGLFDEEIQI